MKKTESQKDSIKQKGDIKFIVLPWDLLEEKEDTTRYPLGVAYLGSFLESKGYKTSLLNLSYTAQNELEEPIINMDMNDNTVVCISVLSENRTSLLRITKIIKRLNSQVKIIVGGQHPTFLYEQILNNFPIDFVVLGEGEITLLELLESNFDINYLKNIKGIAFKYNEKIIKTPPRERIKDLDSLPFPKHEFFKNNIENSGTAIMITSRGCPFNCGFCPSSAYWGRYRTQRSAESVFREMEDLIKSFPDLRRISFFDDEFLVDNNRIIRLCNLIIKSNLKIEWDCIGRLSSINEEIIRLMKKSGCTSINFGFESGSQKILDNIGKEVKIEQVLKIIKMLDRNEMGWWGTFFIGYPGENSKTIKETIKFAKTIKFDVEPKILLVYPGTKIYNLAKEKKLLTEDYWLTDGLVPLYTCEHPKWKLWLWCFKIGFFSNFYTGTLFNFLNRRIFIKLKPRNFYRVFKRYVLN
jgi:radical SAM superfamily enzyme YgiQ (UPF0313 family)